jgi:hypothetical protein
MAPVLGGPFEQGVHVPEPKLTLCTGEREGVSKVRCCGVGEVCMYNDDAAGGGSQRPLVLCDGRKEGCGGTYWRTIADHRCLFAHAGIRVSWGIENVGVEVIIAG